MAEENERRGSPHHSRGRLEAVLRAGEFAITAETSPPDASDPETVLRRVECLRDLADGVNVTDGAGARAHMSALAAAAVMAREGIEPVLQFTTRDRNRLALEGDVIGAAALGIHNILCLTGDPISVGDEPDAKAVFDLASPDLIAAARCMRDESTLPSGRRLVTAPQLFLGGADSPLDPPPGWKPTGLANKIEAGVDFIQTQFCFDTALLGRYLACLADNGLVGRAHFLVGIGPLASARSARWMIGNLPGVTIPEAVIARLEGAQDQAAEGRRICAELIDELREMEGVSGVHLMAPRGEQAIAEVIAEVRAAAPRRKVV